MELPGAWLPPLPASPPGWPGQEHTGGQGGEAPPLASHGRVLLVEGRLDGRSMRLGVGRPELPWDVTERGDAELECLSKLNRLPPMKVAKRPRPAGGSRVQGWARARHRTRAQGWLGATAGPLRLGRPSGVRQPSFLRLRSCSWGLSSGAVLGGVQGGPSFLRVLLAGSLLIWLRGRARL